LSPHCSRTAFAKNAGWGEEGNPVYTRRDLARLALGGVLGGSALFGSLCATTRWAWAAGRKVLTRETTRANLIHENPADLDTTHLEITPLDAFETMGPTDRVVDLATWRLEIAGLVRRPLRLTYDQLTALPPIEREVLLICPGVFANHGRWKGLSIATLLRQADFDPTATGVSVEEAGGKTARFPLPDVLSGKVFLAYQVNGTALPRKHGFPLRAVAEGVYGAEWVKYVDRLTVERT
jgi:DMSO/TMAO reductase YedYZ molybdopterin-dependent catalytic subunit